MGVPKQGVKVKAEVALVLLVVKAGHADLVIVIVNRCYFVIHLKASNPEQGGLFVCLVYYRKNMKYLLKQHVFIILFLLSMVLFSCGEENSQKDNGSSIIIRLEKSTEINNMFDPRYTDFHFKSYYLEYPKFYEHLLKFDSLPKVDTFLLASYYYDNKRFYYDLYKRGFIDDSIFTEKAKSHNIDTLSYSTSKIRDGLTAFVGINKGNQILILDENRNMDFSDDRVFTFNRNLIPDSTITLTSALSRYDYDLYEKAGTLSEYKRKILLYPSPKHPHTYFFEDSLNRKLHIMGKLRDFWKGGFEYNGHGFTVLCQGFRKDFFQILIKPDSLKFSDKNIFFNKNFEYHIKDTLSLFGDLFKIDSIDNSLSNLYFSKIEGENIQHGFRIGQTLDDIELEDLKSGKFKISELRSGKEYILLDFWGTWCPPCKKTVPQLKELNNTYFKSLDIVSIAYDNEVRDVREYVAKNKLNWKHAYIERKYDAPIIHRLRIESFPTFILMDKNKKIILRDSGINALDEISGFLSKKSN